MAEDTIVPEPIDNLLPLIEEAGVIFSFSVQSVTPLFPIDDRPTGHNPWSLTGTLRRIYKGTLGTRPQTTFESRVLIYDGPVLSRPAGLWVNTVPKKDEEWVVFCRPKNDAPEAAALLEGLGRDCRIALPLDQAMPSLKGLAARSAVEVRFCEGWIAEQYKDSRTSDLEITVKPVSTTLRPSKILSLPIEIRNDSRDTIRFRAPRERHGGEWPSTDLYIAAIHTQNDARPEREGGAATATFCPVYVAGESPKDSGEMSVPPKTTVSLNLRMDWRGTGSVRANPVLRTKVPGQYAVRLFLAFRAHGKQQHLVSGPFEISVRLGGD